MEIKLARQELNSKPKVIKLEDVEKKFAEANQQKIFYFDKENSHKDMMNLIDHFEESGYAVYFREVRYGLDESDYMYEVHVL